jgi:peptide/nickel transport system substrate-binding protein
MAMTRTVRGAGAAVLGTLVALTLVGVARAQSPSPSPEKLTFIVGQTNDVRTFNPLKAIESPEYETMGAIYDTLLGWDKDTMEPVPALATEWSVSEDGLTWTFKIRDDVTWSDGQPLTARDIAFTFNFILENNFSALTSYLTFTDEITAPDDTTLVWKTTKPTTAPIAPPFIFIIPEHVWGGMSKEEAKQFPNFPDTVGSGPFRLVEWKKGDFWRLEANEDYWGGAPVIDELVFRVFKNDEAMVQALRAGEIDIAYGIPPTLFASLQGAPGITTHVGAALGFTQMSFGQCFWEGKPCKGATHHPALADLDVRRAVAMAIEKQALVDRVLGGFGTPGTTVIPPAYPWHYEPSPDELIPFDLAGANALLDEAGYLDTDGDGVREMPGGGRPLEFRFIVRTEDPDSVKAGQLISGWLKQIGIATNPEAVTDGKLIDLWLANDYDLYIWGWGVEPDPDFQLSTYTTDQCLVWSDTCYSNPEYDRLYVEQKTTASREERKQIVDEMQRIIYRDIPEIVLYYDNDLMAYRSDRWTGFVEQPAGQGNLVYQYGTYTYRNVRPVSAAGGPPPREGGIPASAWIGILIGLVVVAGAVVLARRRVSEEDRA